MGHGEGHCERFVLQEMYRGPAVRFALQGDMFEEHSGVVLLESCVAGSHSGRGLHFKRDETATPQGLPSGCVPQ